MADRIVVMNHGTIEQVGTPREIYGRPASAFVADFVGAMNAVPGEISGNRFMPRGGAIAIVLASGMADGPARLCVRPEDVEVSAATSGSAGSQLSAIVDSVEFLGAFTRLRLSVPAWGGALLMVDVAARQMRGMATAQGDTVQFALDPACLQVLPARHEA